MVVILSNTAKHNNHNSTCFFSTLYLSTTAARKLWLLSPWSRSLSSGLRGNRWSLKADAWDFSSLINWLSWKYMPQKLLPIPTSWNSVLEKMIPWWASQKNNKKLVSWNWFASECWRRPMFGHKLRNLPIYVREQSTLTASWDAGNKIMDLYPRMVSWFQRLNRVKLALTSSDRSVSYGQGLSWLKRKANNYF